MRTTIAFASFLFLGGGCGGDSGTGKGVSSATLAELDAIARVPNRAVALQSALVAQGTIQVGVTDDEVLGAVNGRLGTETDDCAIRTVTPGQIAVTFPAPGCTLATGGIVVAGTATITVAHASNTLQIVTHFDGTAATEAWTGEVVIGTLDGNQYTLTVLASLAGHESDIRAWTALAESGQSDTTANGSTPSLTAGAAARIVTYTAVSQQFYACHPSSGSIRLVSQAENIDRTLTYQSESASTGVATYTDGTTTSNVTLPSNGSCSTAK